MALRDTLEIYIPVEADVKCIPLWSLPNSILRRMSLPLSDSDGSRKLTNSPKGTWICPVVIRRKGLQAASDTGADVKKEFLCLMGRESQAKSVPHRLSFVSSNRTAYEVLKATKHGSAVSAETSHTSLQCQDLPPKTIQDAVVVYNGQIYLSLRNANRKQSKGKMCDPKRVSQSFAPSTSDLSSKTQMKVFPDNKALKKQITCEVTNSDNTVEEKGSYVTTSMNLHSVPESTNGVNILDCQDARTEQATDDVADLQPDQFKPLEEEVANNVSGECEMQEEAESLDHTSVMDFCMSPKSTRKDDQSSNYSWTREEPLEADTSLQKESEFNDLEQDELIARLKARFKEKNDALSSLS
ncbi:uncharacterized protein LOC114858697 [Betta splendens]|uniref:Uncharacterized protein LOC114858697 n=1 Tax=Betta splendens TaxID=158456 RepID=A0A6P7N138_BETSP|nr:uncharacterized protein LOC114858697 [Betta splendens]